MGHPLTPPRCQGCHKDAREANPGAHHNPSTPIWMRKSQPPLWQGAQSLAAGSLPTEGPSNWAVSTANPLPTWTTQMRVPGDLGAVFPSNGPDWGPQEVPN